jgi:hypothetical protein
MWPVVGCVLLEFSIFKVACYDKATLVRGLGLLGPLANFAQVCIGPGFHTFHE